MSQLSKVVVVVLVVVVVANVHVVVADRLIRYGMRCPQYVSHALKVYPAVND